MNVNDMMMNRMNQNFQTSWNGAAMAAPGPEAPKNDRYNNRAIRWLDKGTHYELIFTDDFITPSTNGNPAVPGSGSTLLTDVITDMKDANKQKEVHVFIGSFGGQVTALSMVFQQLLQFEHRVGINLGTACSCGWMLLFACQERYVSPYSQAVYHEMSSFACGKHTEIRNQKEFMDRWQQELNKVTDTAKVLTEDELELGRTSEVWFTGREVIERGAAKDYALYAKRTIPQPAPGIVDVNGTLYKRNAENRWQKIILTEEPAVSYAELLKMLNDPKPEPEAEAQQEASKPEVPPEEAPVKE